MKKRFLGVALLAAVSATAGDWPQFRGPHGNGVADETRLAWKLDATNAVAWTVNLPGRGVSSPIVVRDRVLITAASGAHQDQLHVLCLNAADGSVRWERTFWATGRTMCAEKTSVAGPTPASDGERVFALFSSNDLFCLDLDGNLIWLRGVTLDYPNVSNSLGMASSLVVAGGVLIAQVETDTESYAIGFDPLTGTNRWRLDRPRMANWTSPVRFKSSEGQTLVTLQSGKGVAAIEPATGKVVWNYTGGAATIPSGAVANGVLYVPSFGITALEPEPGQPAPKQLWRAGTLRPGMASPTVVGDRVYVVNDAGVLSCGATATGQRLWQLRLKGPISASPVVVGNTLLAVSEKGLIQAVDLSQPEGTVIGERDLGDTVLATPAVAHGALYVRSYSKLWKFGTP